MGIVKAVCISEKRGTLKKPVDSVELIVDYGIKGDAHAGNWHRQVSLLSDDKIQEFKKLGPQVVYGAFGENIVVEGIDFRSLPVGTWMRCGEVLLEMTQIGKECHSHCAIYKQVGDCIMPREGVFAKVLHGGIIRPGDIMEITQRTDKRPYQAAVITMSDRCSAGEREDLSGPALKKRLEEKGYEVIEMLILPDGIEPLSKELIRLSDQRHPDLILTTGGTGLAKRDLTPEATKAVAERDVPGIAEAIRAESMKITNRAMLSRGASVVRGNTLIINLPGSPKGAVESLDAVVDVLPHALDLLRSEVVDCAR